MRLPIATEVQIVNLSYVSKNCQGARECEVPLMLKTEVASLSIERELPEMLHSNRLSSLQLYSIVQALRVALFETSPAHRRSGAGYKTADSSVALSLS